MILSRKCLSGEAQTSGNTCEKCGYGFYLLQPPDREKKCKQCELNAECKGENSLIPNEGYFRSSNDSSEILQCRNQKACKQGDVENPLGQCSVGYQPGSYMCGSCDDDHVNRHGLDCSKCPGKQENAAYSFFKLIWLTILILTIAKMNEQYAQESKQYHLGFQMSIKLMINHCVVISAINSIPYNWYYIIDKMINKYGENYLVGLFADLIQFRCLILNRQAEAHNSAIL